MEQEEKMTESNSPLKFGWDFGVDPCMCYIMRVQLLVCGVHQLRT